MVVDRWRDWSTDALVHAHCGNRCRNQKLMGTYNLSPDEIADKLEQIEFESKLEGDFTEKDFVDGAKLYIKRLRLEGAHIEK